MALLLLDNFTGAAGALSGHTADSGASWTGSDSQAVLNGSGRLCNNTANTAPSLATSIAAPQSATLSITASVVVTGLPTSGVNQEDYLEFDLWGAGTTARVIVDSWGYNPTSGLNEPLLTIATYATTNSFKTYPVSNGDSHTVRWDITYGTDIKVYLDSVLIATTGAPYGVSGSTQISGVLNNTRTTGYAGAAFLFIESIQVDGAAPSTDLLRDNFTGSTDFISRAPDTAGIGVWQADPASGYFPPNIAVVTGGVLKFQSTPSQVFAYTPLAGDPVHVYAEIGVISTSTSNITLGINRIFGGSGGIRVQIQATSPTAPTPNVAFYYFNDSGSDSVSGYATTVNAPTGAFTVRLALGTDNVARIYLNAAEVWSHAVGTVPTGGGVYLALNSSTLATVDYIVTNSLVPPPFWMSFAGSHEVP